LKRILPEAAINEVADLGGSDRRLWKICDGLNINHTIFAPIIVNEDRVAVAIDLARPFLTHIQIEIRFSSRTHQSGFPQIPQGLRRLTRPKTFEVDVGMVLLLAALFFNRFVLQSCCYFRQRPSRLIPSFYYSVSSFRLRCEPDKSTWFSVLMAAHDH
jgi:hypothetical protein